MGKRDRAKEDMWLTKFAQYNNKILTESYDYYIFLTRKCYHYTSAVVKYAIEKINLPDENKILRDRDLIKELDFSMLRGKRLLLIDDTIIDGDTLKNLLQFLDDKINLDVTEIDIAAFAVSCDVATRIIKLKYFRKCNLKFMNILSNREMEEFISHEMNYIHEHMISYVIDLPVMKTKHMSRDMFTRIKEQDRTAWKYYDNQLAIGNHHYANGLFLFCNEYLERKFSKILLSMVVKCRYESVEKIDNEKLKFTFTPFVMLKSVDYQEMKSCFMELFAGTEYAKLINDKKYSKNEDYVTVYRAVVYCLSYYLGLLFADYFSAFSIQLGENREIYKESSLKHLSAEFDRSIKEIFQENEKKNFLDRLNDIHSFEYGVPQDGIVYTEDNETPYDIVENYIAQKIALCKVEFVKKGLLPESHNNINNKEIILEDIQKIITTQFIFKSKIQYQSYISRVLLKLLDQSSLSNSLFMDHKEGRIVRAFRYGENSDVYITEDEDIFYAGVYSYYKMMRTYDMYKKCYQTFIRYFRKYLIEKGYFDYNYISSQSFDFYEKFYDQEKEILEREMENKRILLDANMNSEREAIQEIIRFVEKKEYVYIGDVYGG